MATHLAVAFVGAQTSTQTPIYEGRTNLTTPNALLVADLVHTPSPEVILTDVRGRLRMYRLEGEVAEIRSLDVSKGALTAPVVGDFLGRNTMDLAVGTSLGEVIVLDGSTLATIATLTVPDGKGFSVQGTTVPRKQADGSTRDDLVLADADGTIRSFQVEAGGVKQMWTYPTGAKVQAPIVVGSVRSRGAVELVATTSDGHLVVIDAVTGRGEKATVQERTSLTVSPLLVDTNADELDEIVVALPSQIRSYRWDTQKQPRLQPAWSQPLKWAPVAPPILLSKGQILASYRVLQFTGSSILVFDASNGNPVAENTTVDGINTEPALVPRAGAYPELAFGMKKTIQITSNLSSWIEGGGREALRLREGTLNHLLTNTIVSAVVREGEPAVFVASSPEQDGHLYVFNSDYVVSPTEWPTRTPWMTQGGSPLHNPTLDYGWARMERQRREALLAQVADWDQRMNAAIDAGEWEIASELAKLLVDYDPYDVNYASLQWRIWRSKHFFKIVTVTILTLLIGGYTTFVLGQVITFRRSRRRAETAVARGDYETARRLYQRLVAKRPQNRKVALDLARVYMAQRDYSSETLTVYSFAHQIAPEDSELLHAFARAMVLEPKTGEDAEKLYLKALSTFPEPALLEYGLGRVYLAQGKYDEAGKRLRSALRGGIATDALYSALCDVYMRTQNFSAKSLPVFQQQYNARREDREFMEAYLAACIDAKKMDAQVEGLCQAVLELSRQHVPAYLQLARILMQKGQAGAAIEEIRTALKFDPANREAILLMAQCYMVQSRKDDEAVQAYRRALAEDRTDRELLRALAGIYFDRGQFDEEAVGVYRRSIEQNPTDVPTLKALAQTAQLTADHELSIRAVEALAQQGQLNPRLVQQLSTAYVRTRNTEPKTERIFREALRHDPQNLEYTAALARVLVAQDRDDADAVPLYETHLRHYDDDIAIGRQLAKAYIKANRYENALATAQRFLKLSPEDEELQRLNALASLYDNKIDEAVSEYRRILDRSPDNREALVNLALAYAQKLRTDEEAVLVYARALTVQPDNDMLHLAMARVSADRNDAAAAVDAYRKALKAKDNNEQKVIAHILNLLSERPEILRIRWFLVEIMVSYGHLREALEQVGFINQNHPGQATNVLRALDTILGKDPNNVTAILQKGLLQLASDSIPEAVRTLDRAYSLQPTSPEIQDALISAYVQRLEQKDEPETRFKLGRIYYTQQEYDAAIGSFQKTAQDYRWEGESTKMLGKCFVGKGMLDLALQEYKKLVVDDETKELLYDLAQRYEAKRDLVGAKTVYRQLFAADIDYKDVKTRFEMLSGSTSDPMAFEKTSIVQQMSEEAARRYELLDELGRGAMGIVYRARDKELEEIVALKILPDNMSNNPEAVRRFKIEARNARKLSHPNIVRIHDIGEEMGRKYISMEYVDGSDLKRKIKTSPENRLTIDQVVKYGRQIADALGYAHRLGIVHRDIKPANIMLTSTDEVKVTDFGIAKMMDATGEGTMIGAVIGTPLYMSPEQVMGVPVDNRADIYAYGIMIYEMLNGRPPFTDGDLAYQHLHRDPDPIPGLKPALWEVVRKCLAKKKEDRWERAEMVYDALRDV